MKNIDSGFIRIASAIPQLKVADCNYNKEEVLSLIKKAVATDVAIISFPELCLTSVSCGDLLYNELLLVKAEEALKQLLIETQSYNIISVIGMPITYGHIILNVAVVFSKGKIVGVVPKERSLFKNVNKSFSICGQEVTLSQNSSFSTDQFCFSISFWDNRNETLSSLYNDDISIYLSSECEVLGGSSEIKEILSVESKTQDKACLYSSPGFGESTTDHVFGGYALLVDSGELLSENKLFIRGSNLITSDIDIASIRALKRRRTFRLTKEINPIQINFHAPLLDSINRNIDPFPFLAIEEEKDEKYKSALAIQAQGLIQRLVHTSTKKVVVGISGGLDSTLALLVCLQAFDALQLPRENIIGVTMPGFGTTGRTYANAWVMMKKMGISTREISIKEACLLHFKDIGHDANVHDITYENSQARERTQILMDIANQEYAMVIGTGDLSELALGWATYNGDHMSMYAVNASVPKTLVQDLVGWKGKQIMKTDEELGKTLLDVLDTPISPELTPATESGDINQKTEDFVGPYALHDFFIYHTLKYGHSPRNVFKRAELAFENRYSSDSIVKWLYSFYRRFFTQQFKRSCLPDGPNVTGLSLSPRNGWNMVSDATATLWLLEVEEIKKSLETSK